MYKAENRCVNYENGTQITRIMQMYNFVIQIIICVIRVICVPLTDYCSTFFR